MELFPTGSPGPSLSCSWMLLLDAEHVPRVFLCWRHPRLLLGECLWECKADWKGHLVICAGDGGHLVICVSGDVLRAQPGSGSLQGLQKPGLYEKLQPNRNKQKKQSLAHETVIAGIRPIRIWQVQNLDTNYDGRISSSAGICA